MSKVRIEKIIIVGAPSDWADKKTVTLETNGNTSEAEVIFTPGASGKASVAIIRDPKAPITADWTISF